MSATTFLLSILTLKCFGLTTFMVEGPSMEATLHSGEIFLVNENVTREKAIQRGNIVVFSLSDDPGYYYVKRVIGLPGDRVQIRQDGVYLQVPNGVNQRLTEPYLSVTASSVPVTGAYRSDFKQTFVVPNGKYFVLGDNREHSLDSRYFRSPFVDQSSIVGTYFLPLPQF